MKGITQTFSFDSVGFLLPAELIPFMIFMSGRV